MGLWMEVLRDNFHRLANPRSEWFELCKGQWCDGISNLEDGGPRIAFGGVPAGRGLSEIRKGKASFVPCLSG